MEGLPRLNRRYTPYTNSPLPTTEAKLLFLLVHMKQHLTQAVHGQLFGMMQSDANKWLQRLRPVLLQTLQALDVMPVRRAALVAAPERPPDTQRPLFIMMAQKVLSNDQ